MARRTIRLFVYGSLMRGQTAHRLLAALSGARRVGRGSIGARLLDLRRYPGAVRDPGGVARVHGELWEIESRPCVLASLDSYEAFDRRAPDASLFVRRRTIVRLARGGAVRAWAYFLRRVPASAPIVASGDWRMRPVAHARNPRGWRQEHRPQ